MGRYFGLLEAHVTVMISKTAAFVTLTTDQVLYLSQDYLPLIISFLHFCGTVHEIHTGANTLSHCQQLPSKYS